MVSPDIDQRDQGQITIASSKQASPGWSKWMGWFQCRLGPAAASTPAGHVFRNEGSSGAGCFTGVAREATGRTTQSLDLLLAIRELARGICRDRPVLAVLRRDPVTPDVRDTLTGGGETGSETVYSCESRRIALISLVQMHVQRKRRKFDPHRPGGCDGNSSRASADQPRAAGTMWARVGRAVRCGTFSVCASSSVVDKPLSEPEGCLLISAIVIESYKRTTTVVGQRLSGNSGALGILWGYETR